MNLPLFTNIESADLSQAFNFPLDLGNGAPNAHYFRSIRQVFVTSEFEIFISLNEPKDVFSIFATHSPVVDSVTRTVICPANSLVPIAIHSDAPRLLPAWEILGATQIVYTIEDGVLFDAFAQARSNQIAAEVTTFRFKFCDRFGAPVEDPVMILRAISRFEVTFRCFVVYCIWLNDPAIDNVALNNFQVSRELIADWPAPAWSIEKIIADEWLVVKNYFWNEMSFLSRAARDIYMELSAASFHALLSISALASFESDLDNGLAEYVFATDQFYYLLIYEKTQFTFDLIHVRKDSTVLSTVPSLTQYTTIINGPFFSEADDGGGFHVGGRKFATTHDGKPLAAANSFHNGWNVASGFETEFKGKLVVADTGNVQILAGDLTDDELRTCRCGSDSLPLVMLDGNSNLERFKSEYLSLSVSFFSGLGAPFIGDFVMNGRDYFFVLVKENNSRKFASIAALEPYQVYQQVFDVLGARNVVYTDGSDSVALFHKNFSSGPFEGSYSKFGRAKNDCMPALFGIKRR